MSIATLILGNSGSGKSTSMRNLKPEDTLLIQCLKKPLPFKTGKGWKVRISTKSEGNIIQTDNPVLIEKVMRNSTAPIIIIDDYQAVMVNELMDRCSEKGYDKFTEIAKHAFDIFSTSGELAQERRVYIMAHTQQDDFGNVRMKTVGKMVDQTLVPEGYFTTVLRTEVQNGTYSFRTQTNGQDCVKSPMGMFDDLLIDNDLAAVDAAICEFYGLTETA